MQRSTGIGLLVGSLVLSAGALFPVVQDVFAATDDPAAMASAIAGDESAWTAANVLFMLGALLVAGGLWGLARGSAIGTVAGVVAVAGALVCA
jgi:ABC-type sulfate transport system permease component